MHSYWNVPSHPGVVRNREWWPWVWWKCRQEKINQIHKELSRPKADVRLQFSLAFPSKATKPEFCLCLTPSHGGDHSQKEKGQQRLVKNKWSAQRAIAVDSPFSSSTQTRALPLTPSHHYHLSLLKGYQVKMKNLNAPWHSTTLPKYRSRIDNIQCQKGLTGFCFIPCSFSAAAPTLKATCLPSQLSVQSHFLTSTEMEFQTRKCLMSAPTQKVSDQLFLAISFPMQPFNTSSRWEYEAT